jgi:hypothetical protein
LINFTDSLTLGSVWSAKDEVIPCSPQRKVSSFNKPLPPVLVVEPIEVAPSPPTFQMTDSLTDEMSQYSLDNMVLFEEKNKTQSIAVTPERCMTRSSSKVSSRRSPTRRSEVDFEKQILEFGNFDASPSKRFHPDWPKKYQFETKTP